MEKITVKKIIITCSPTIIFSLIPGGRVGDQRVLRAGRQGEIGAEADTLCESIPPPLVLWFFRSLPHLCDLRGLMVLKIYSLRSFLNTLTV